MTNPPQHHKAPSTPAEWDERYLSAPDHIWSGKPNGSLVDEIAGVTPGRALDLGCGEGADAIWLAEQGWQATGIDMSQVAIDRAGTAAHDAGVDVSWLAGDFLSDHNTGDTYDLVTAHYLSIRKTTAEKDVPVLLDAVAAGGTLLFVAHQVTTDDPEHPPLRDPAEYIQPDDLVAYFDDGWKIVTHEVRERHSPAGAPAQHTHDVILKAVRQP